MLFYPSTYLTFFHVILFRRRFEIYFKTSSDTKSIPIRDVKSNCIGKLINIKGIITRGTEVKPMMQV